MTQKTKDQDYIQRQIDECHAKGGGRVILSAGIYHCGMIRLKSGVNLHLEAGVEILGSPSLDDYPTLAPTVNESTDIRALIFIDEAEGVSITGDGIINGGANRPLAGKDIKKEPTRPELIFVRNSKYISFKGITLKNSSFWTLHLMSCEDITIDAIKIKNRTDRINTDGIDPDGCKRVKITNCDITTGDDCIVLKSTEGDDCEDIIVSNCLLQTHCTALKLGTESIGNIRNVIFSNCIIKNSRMAFGLFMKDGGTFENITATNLIIEDQTEFPLFIDSTPRYYDESPDGYIRNVTLSNITLNSPGRLFINGSDKHPVENVILSDITWNLNNYLKLGSMGKPPGSVRGRKNPNRTCHEFAKAQFTLANIDGFSLSNIHVKESRRGSCPDRTLFYTDKVNHSSQHSIQSDRVNWMDEAEANNF